MTTSKLKPPPIRMPKFEYLSLGFGIKPYQQRVQSYRTYVEPPPRTPEPYAPSYQGHAHRYFYQMYRKGDDIIRDERKVVERKNQAEMTPDEKSNFQAAYESLIASGFISNMVEHHRGPYAMHGTQRFLPWHRVYLDLLEEELLLSSPGTFIPYWNWTVDRAIPDWIASWTPQIPDPDGGTINVGRNNGDISGLLPTQNQVDTTMGLSPFDTFTFALEQHHNIVHVRVGGTMSAINTAPADPIFWMHHSEIDRLWHVWQQNNPGDNPSLFGADTVMTPWSNNEQDTRDIEQDFGYKYV